MASAARKVEAYITPQEHERLELETGIRYEWYDGEVFAMAGARPDHNTISANILASLHSQLRGKPCQPWGSDQQVKIRARQAVPYPDVSVACPPFEYDTQHPNALTNPRVIIEVLSPSTEKYDRAGKFNLYKQIPTLTDYILVASEHRYIEHFARQESGAWAQVAAPTDGDCISIASIGCSLCLDDVYYRLDLPDRSQSPGGTPGRVEE